MAEVRITYEALFDLLRRERNREELQTLDKTFYNDVLTYLSEKKALLEQQQTGNPYETNAEAERTRIQFHNIKKILKELYDRREKKLVTLALNTVRTGTNVIDRNKLLAEETLLFDDLARTFTRYRQEVLDQLLRQTAPFGGVTPQSRPVPNLKAHDSPMKTPTTNENQLPKKTEEKETTQGQKIKFTKAVPRFAGAADKVYGPYAAGDEATLPTKIASVLVRKGRAEEV